MMSSFYDLNAQLLSGERVEFSRYSGQVTLVVNFASACGFTSQYAGLEKLFQDYRSKGLLVLGFPCNQFGEQESGSAEEITAFCQINFGVTFPLFSKIDVNGPSAHPIYVWLKKNCPITAEGGKRDIGWNFNKFLVNRNGQPTQRFGGDVEPENLQAHIEALL